MASAVRPRLVSHRGLSGTKNRATRNSAAGRTPDPSIQRQPVDTFQASLVGEAIHQLTIETTSMPVMMATWLSDTRRPRMAAGATSAIYNGESIEAVPTAKPPNRRAITNSVRFRGKAAPMAETANSRAASNKIFFRPKRSLKVLPARRRSCSHQHA